MECSKVKFGKIQLAQKEADNKNKVLKKDVYVPYYCLNCLSYHITSNGKYKKHTEEIREALYNESIVSEAKEIITHKLRKDKKPIKKMRSKGY